MKRILLVNPIAALSLYSRPDVADITGRSAYIMNIALPTLAALAPRGVEVSIVDEAVERVNFDSQWDLVGITGYVTQGRRIREIAAEFRRRGQLVAIGGPYATLSPEAVRPYADILFRGEAELTWPAFLQDFLQPQDRWQTEYAAHDAVDIADSPLPDIGRLRPNAYELGVVQTSRGCPFECEFCDVIVYLGRRQRHKSPSRVVDELEQLYRAGYRSVFLADDNLTANRRRAAEIMSEVGEWNRRLPEQMALFTQLSIDITRDRDQPLLELCAEAGLKHVFVGIETPNADALREVHKRQNLRDDLVADVHRIQQHGILVEAGMITGFDSDTLDCFVREYEFLQAAGIPKALVAMLWALDGTPLQRRLAGEGRLKPVLLADAALDTNIIPKQMTHQQLLKGTIWLLNRLYRPRAFLERLSVLASHLPTRPGGRPSGTPDDALFWERLARSYAALGSEFRDMPIEAARYFRGRDTYSLRVALVSYRSVIGVLNRWGVRDPRVGSLAAPDFRTAA